MTRTLLAHMKGNAVAYAALFVALGGTSYAASLPRNSVGTKQLRANAVTSSKVRDGSLSTRDFAAGSLPRGPRGAEGPKGDAGPVGGTLPSGTTLRGRFEAGEGNASATAPGNVASDAISFGSQLASPPLSVIVPPKTAGPPQCPGSTAEPQAAAGYLCIYVGEQVNISAINTILEGGVVGTTSKQGVGVFVVAAAGGTFGARGSWAVTAP